MTAITVEVRTHNTMWGFFRSKKEREREKALEAKEAEIKAIKADTVKAVDKATLAVKQLNDLVESHGINGIIYFSTGKKR